MARIKTSEESMEKGHERRWSLIRISRRCVSLCFLPLCFLACFRFCGSRYRTIENEREREQTDHERKKKKNEMDIQKPQQFIKTGTLSIT